MSLLELLYPFRRRELRSSLSPAEAAQALAGEVEPRKLLRLRWKSRTFEGTVGDGVFDIERIISYRSSSLPRIRGTIRADAHGCSISVTMSLSLSALIVLAILLVIATLDSLPSSSLSGTPFVPVAILAFAWLITIFGFHFEAAKAERALLRILKASRWRRETAQTGRQA